MARDIWEQLDDENEVWYLRFEQYRLLGPGRNLTAAYRMAQVLEPERLTAALPGTQWRERFIRHRWLERARAFDNEERQRFRLEEREVADDKRRTRLQMISELKTKAFTGLMAAHIDELDEKQARVFFPQLRMLMLGLLAVERNEFYNAEVVEVDPAQDEQALADLEAAFDRAWPKAEGVTDVGDFSQ